MEKQNTEVIYVRGNHDDFLDGIIPLSFANFHIVKDYILESSGKLFLVTHGDVFDKVTTQMKWLAKLGDIGYTILLHLNNLYNRYRTRKGKPYYSLSQTIKQRVKTAVSYISDFEKILVNYGAHANVKELSADISTPRKPHDRRNTLFSTQATGLKRFQHLQKIQTENGT